MFKVKRLACFTLASLSLVFLSVEALAQEFTNEYVAYYQHAKTIDSRITDKQCQKLFSEPLHYTIQNDKPVYQANNGLVVYGYQRTSMTPIDATHVAYTGVQKARFFREGQKHPVDINVEFTLDKSAHTVTGTWQAVGYCSGTWVGNQIKK